MFHRILSRDDPRWDSCDPDYTLSVDVLAHALAFFKRHYNVVSLAQVLEARRSGASLPARALLITFDDGWADNADYALPELRRAGLPALLFVVADAIGQRQPFYQERIMSAWRRGALRVNDLADLLVRVVPAEGVPTGNDVASLRAVISRIEKLDPEQRGAVLAPLAESLDDGLRHMVDVDDLKRLESGGVALGLHGKSHVPMTSAFADLDAELGGARSVLAAWLGKTGDAAVSMSFPHGAHDRDIAQRARDAGYELVFTSARALNPVRPRPGWLLGRTGFDTGNVIDDRGRFRPDWLALYLFRPPLRRFA